MKQYRAAAGLILSAAFLYLAFRETDWGRTWAVMRTVSWPWFLPAAVALVGHFYLRAVRWRYLLLPAADLSANALFGPMMIGFMVNNVLPLRVGEFARAWALARRTTVSGPAALATIVVERIFDGLMLLLLLLVSAPFLPIQTNPQIDALIRALLAAASVIYAAAVAVIVLLKWRSTWALKALDRIRDRFPRAHAFLHRLVTAFVTGLDAVGDWRLMLAAAAWSLPVWLVCGLFYYLTMLAFTGPGGVNLGASVGFFGGVFVLVGVALGVMLPSSPGFVGAFQLGVVAALAALGFTGPLADGYAILVHVIQYVPVTLIGLFFLYRQNFSLRQARRESEKLSGGTT
jgi:hypothetical protein